MFFFDFLFSKNETSRFRYAELRQRKRTYPFSRKGVSPQKGAGTATKLTFVGAGTDGKMGRGEKEIGNPVKGGVSQYLLAFWDTIPRSSRNKIAPCFAFGQHPRQGIRSSFALPHKILTNWASKSCPMWWGFLQFRKAESAGEGVGASASKLVLTATDRPSLGGFFAQLSFRKESWNKTVLSCSYFT